MSNVEAIRSRLSSVVPYLSESTRTDIASLFAIAERGERAEQSLQRAREALAPAREESRAEASAPPAEPGAPVAPSAKKRGRPPKAVKASKARGAKRPAKRGTDVILEVLREHGPLSADQAMAKARDAGWSTGSKTPGATFRTILFQLASKGAIKRDGDSYSMPRAA